MTHFINQALLAANDGTNKLQADQIMEFARWLFSKYDFVGTLALCIVIDILTGFIAAGVQWKLNSTTCFAGMCRKAAIVLLVALGMALVPLSNGLPIDRMIAAFYIVAEALSILENCGRAGVPLPPWLKKWLIKLREDNQQTPPVVIPPQQNINVSAKNVSINPETVPPGVTKEGTKIITTVTTTETEP